MRSPGPAPRHARADLLWRVFEVDGLLAPAGAGSCCTPWRSAWGSSGKTGPSCRGSGWGQRPS